MPMKNKKPQGNTIHNGANIVNISPFQLYDRSAIIILLFLLHIFYTQIFDEIEKNKSK